MKTAMSLIAMVVLSVAIAGCATFKDFGKKECKAFALLMHEAVRVVSEDVTNAEEKAARIASYNALALQAVDLGCEFVPPPMPE